MPAKAQPDPNSFINLFDNPAESKMTKQEFAQRRKHLMQLMGDSGVAILPAAPMRIRNRDSEYHYRPDSDFYYLTGFPEPEAVE